MEQKTESKAWGVASLVTGISSLVLFLMPYFGLPLAIFAVVAAHQQDKISKIGISTGGRITGIIGIVINAIVLFIVVIAMAFFGDLLL